MKTNLLSALFILLFTGVALSQPGHTDEESKLEISKLSFMLGDWAGEGWSMGADRQKHTFNQTEKIQLKLDGTLILIEGLGKSEGSIIHNALALISYNKADKNYLFQSYLSDGKMGSFKAEMIDGKLIWYPADNIRYVITVNELGQWLEIGEIEMNGTWYQFFEMTLEKK